MLAFVRLSKIHQVLVPYIKRLVAENAENGIPVQRPLFLQYDTDKKSYSIDYQYMFGPDLLVAPVIEPGRTQWQVYLPPDIWVHFWSGEAYKGPREVTVDAPLGKPPVFFRAKSKWRKLFEAAAEVSFGPSGDFCLAGDDDCS